MAARAESNQSAGASCTAGSHTSVPSSATGWEWAQDGGRQRVILLLTVSGFTFHGTSMASKSASFEERGSMAECMMGT